MTIRTGGACWEVLCLWTGALLFSGVLLGCVASDQAPTFGAPFEPVVAAMPTSFRVPNDAPCALDSDSALLGRECGPCFAYLCVDEAVVCKYVAGARGCPAFEDVGPDVGVTTGSFDVGQFGSGVTMVDLNGDGHLDLVRGSSEAMGVFLGDGAWSFVDATNAVGLDGVVAENSLVVADYDGDAYLDLVITSFMSNAGLRLFRGGSSGFVEVTDLISGPSALLDATGATWGDLDGDGDLDLYVVQYSDTEPNYFYRNDSGMLSEETDMVGLANFGGTSFQGLWFDYDLDGDVDLLVVNDKGNATGVTNTLYRNDGGSIVDVTLASGLGLAIHGMGVAVGDYDGDLDLDIYLTNCPNQPVFGVNNLLFENQGDGTFLERAAAAGVAVGTTSWGARWLDYDHDTDLDLIVACEGATTALQLFRNDGDGAFSNVTAPMGLGALAGPGFAVVAGDIDDDGDLDLAAVATSASNTLHLFRHRGAAGNWLQVSLYDSPWNPWASGAVVIAHVGDRSLMRIQDVGSAYLGAGDPRLHFGLGTAYRVDRLEVRWPGGDVTVLEDVEVNRHITVSR